jgi:hypothetical protein
MPEVGPFMITARNEAQAEYLIRSRAEQRGVAVTGIAVSAASTGMWLVTVTVPADRADDAARLADDTQALHIPPAAGRPGDA